jgi:hypothetical protein
MASLAANIRAYTRCNYQTFFTPVVWSFLHVSDTHVDDIRDLMDRSIWSGSVAQVVGRRTSTDSNIITQSMQTNDVHATPRRRHLQFNLGDLRKLAKCRVAATTQQKEWRDYTQTRSVMIYKKEVTRQLQKHLSLRVAPSPRK